MGMIEKIKAAFNTTARMVEPTVFGDELAMETRWEPLGTQSANYCSHRLCGDPGDGCLRFTAGGMTRAIPWIFGIGGVVVSAVLLSGIIRPFRVMLEHLPFLYAVLPLGAVVGIGVGFFLRRMLNPHIVFDINQGYFYRSRTDPRKIEDISQLPSYTRFKDIGALQLLENYVCGSSKNSSSYMAYELNLVRVDGTRVGVISHGDYRKLVCDAGELAKLLRKPLWDVVAAVENNNKEGES